MGIFGSLSAFLSGKILSTFLQHARFARPEHPKHGQHYGIIIVELGVGITVSFVMIAIYYSFADRTPRLDDNEW